MVISSNFEGLNILFGLAGDRVIFWRFLKNNGEYYSLKKCSKNGAATVVPSHFLK